MLEHQPRLESAYLRCHLGFAFDARSIVDEQLSHGLAGSPQGCLAVTFCRAVCRSRHQAGAAVSIGTRYGSSRRDSSRKRVGGRDGAAQVLGQAPVAAGPPGLQRLVGRGAAALGAGAQRGQVLALVLAPVTAGVLAAQAALGGVEQGAGQGAERAAAAAPGTAAGAASPGSGETGGLGDTRRPMVANVAAMVLNVGGNWLLIDGHLGFAARGVAGAALASALATWLAFAGLLAGFLLEGRRLGAGRRPLSLTELLRMLRFGLPSGLNWFFEFLAFNLFVTVILAGLGTTTLAAFMAVLQVNSVAFMPAFGLASAGAILVGQAIGAGRRDDVPGVVWLTFQVAAGWQGLAGLLYLAAPARSPRPKSCEAKEETMKTTPIGRMKTEKAFMAPVVVAASAAAPRWATMTASETPTTTCDERETTMGQASVSKVRRPGASGAATGRVPGRRLLDADCRFMVWVFPVRPPELAAVAHGLRMNPTRARRLPFAGRQASPSSAASIPSHKQCTISRWTSWILMVRSCGTHKCTSLGPISAPSLPPPLPVSAMTGIERNCAARAAASTLGESPLVEMATRTSPVWPRALTWRAKTSS